MNDTPRDYSITLSGKSLKLYINGFLHLSIRRERLLGVQSWEMDGKFCIEYTLDDAVILTEYNKPDKWKAILKLLDESELYQ
jgi:hypothetical protein